MWICYIQVNHQRKLPWSHSGFRSPNTQGVRDYHRSLVWSPHRMPGFIGLISFSKAAFERGPLFISILKVRKLRPRCWLVCQGRTNGSKQSSDLSLAGWLPSEPWCEVPAVFLPPVILVDNPFMRKAGKISLIFRWGGNFIIPLSSILPLYDLK